MRYFLIAIAAIFIGSCTKNDHQGILNGYYIGKKTTTTYTYILITPVDVELSLNEKQWNARTKGSDGETYSYSGAYIIHQDSIQFTSNNTESALLFGDIKYAIISRKDSLYFKDVDENNIGTTFSLQRK